MSSHHRERPPHRGRPTRLGEPSIGRRATDTAHSQPPAPPSLRVLSSSGFGAPDDARHLVSVLMDVIEEAAPLPAGRRQDLRRDVLELWRELTSERSERQADYIGEPAMLAAYLRYFLPWNVVRLVPLLAGLDLDLAPGSRVLDLGSGPLTLPIALWIARPELRERPLTLVCADRVKRVLELGSAFLGGLALRAAQPGSRGGLAWSLETRKGIFPFERSENETFSLVCAANVFNESFWKAKGRLDERAAGLFEELVARTDEAGRILLVEPGDPRTGAMLAALREACLLGGGSILAPCTHARACPMPGAFLSSAFRVDGAETAALGKVVTSRGRIKAPWCHFVIPDTAAPDRLSAFSSSVGLPKDRLVASYLYASPRTAAEPARHAVRVISDSFRLSDGSRGRYACSSSGYTLVRGALADYPSGTLLRLDGALPGARGERDPKSGAVVLRGAPVPIHEPTDGQAPRPAGSSGSPPSQRSGKKPPRRGPRY